MPRPYSADLRERVLAACEKQEGSQAEIARRFSMAESTVSTWFHALQDGGRRTAKAPGRGPQPRLTAEGQAVLKQLLAEDNDATLADYADRLDDRLGIRISAPVVCGACKRLGLTRKNLRRQSWLKAPAFKLCKISLRGAAEAGAHKTKVSAVIKAASQSRPALAVDAGQVMRGERGQAGGGGGQETDRAAPDHGG